MKAPMVLLLTAFAAASGQDSTSFSELRLRVSAFRNPVIGHIADDWRPGTGGQVELATNVGRGDLGLSVSHIRYTPTSGKPPFTGTMFTLALMTPFMSVARMELSAGARLTDLRLDIDDPALVGGLRTEEEVMLGAIARARLPLGHRFSAFVDGSWGVLMLDTKTPVVLLHAGVERGMRMPGFLREILR
ncbi:MAG TPA: hypothetical protein VFO55_02010 [Gemmatimonadaceae bacterium]|nr:hypothetical protein [Gemmatimonadaceae bacterium]